MNDLAPLVLFVYNRAWHTEQTINALLNNKLSSESEIFIYSDAAKNDAALSDVKEVRDYIDTIKGFKKVTIIKRERNWGLANSIIDGVTELCNKYGRVIVLEDDLETSPYFLNYMNSALSFYQDNENVMHISGCKYPVEPFGKDDTFFLRIPLCWGWATWKRAWSRFDKNIFVMKKFDRKMIKHFNFDGSYNYWKQLELNKSGEIDTWFIFWYAALFLNDGLALFSTKSLVRNIGFDNSGTHCLETNMYNVSLSTKVVSLNAISCVESIEGFNKHKKYFMQFKPGILERALKKIRYMFYV